MAASQTLGVRIPELLLTRLDVYAQEHELTRSMAVARQVEQAISGSEVVPSAVPTEAKETATAGQDTVSGQRAQQWGIRTARKIAAMLQAEKATDQPTANEFFLGGKRIAIKCSRPATTQCGLTNTMRDRVDYVICASQTVGGAFRLYKVTPGQWEENANKPPKHNRNYRNLTHLSRSVYRRIGEDLGEVEIED